jgi:hypothetical protein
MSQLAKKRTISPVTSSKPSTAVTQPGLKTCPSEPGRGSCECCDIFGTALGNTIYNTAKDIAGIETRLIPVLPPHEAKIRIPIAQSIYLQASALITVAFTNPGHISKKCCGGYASAISQGVEGIIIIAISDTYNPYIPLGVPTDIAPGTVYGNAFVAIVQIEGLIAAARRIAKC